jgi:hypothetical protein
MFKNAARSLRFGTGPDAGLRIGVARAIALMPDIGEMYCDRNLLALAGITLEKLERYRTGDGLSQEKARDRIIALGMWRLRCSETSDREMERSGLRQTWPIWGAGVTEINFHRSPTMSIRGFHRASGGLAFSL